MKELLIRGSFEIHSKPNYDERGFLNLFRGYDETFKKLCDNFEISQINLSHKQVGTLRGLHYQKTLRKISL